MIRRVNYSWYGYEGTSRLLTSNNTMLSYDCHLESYARVLGLTLILLFIILGAVGNAVVAGILFYKGRLSPSSTNNFVINLAISDLLMCLFVMPFDVVYWLHFPVWTLEPWICKLWNTFFYALHASASLFIIAISVDTYRTVSDPLNMNAFNGVKNSRKSVCIIWAWSLTVGSLIFTFQKTPPPGEYLFDLNPVAYGLYLIMHMVLPQLLVSYCYLKLFHIAKGHAVHIKSNQVSAEIPSGKQSPDMLNLKERIVLGKTFLIITVAYFFCWTPFISVQVVYVLGLEHTVNWCVLETMDTILCWLAYLQCCLNPVIYAIRKKLFRQLFKRVVEEVT